MRIIMYYFGGGNINLKKMFIECLTDWDVDLHWKKKKISKSFVFDSKYGYRL